LRTFCCRCVVGCSVLVSLAAVPARAQSIATVDAAPPVAQVGEPVPFSQPGLFPSKQKSFFSQLFDDYRAIPTRENLIIAGLGGLVAAAGHPVDPHVTRTLSGSERMGTTLSAGQMVGAAFVHVAGGVATQAIGRATSNPRLSALGSDLVRGQIVSQTVTFGIKMAAQRTRPDGTQYSFPSGHSASAFATATVLQRHLGWKAGVPAYAMATYVAASRVQTKRHYFSDVAMGAAIGVIAGRSVTVGRGDARFAVAPSVVPGGGGVSFTWVGRE
jgi:membrane-associated phospholipid phosphatase